MSATKYTVEHEWVRVDEAGLVTIGITAYAQEQLGDIVFVQVPDVGRELAQGDEAVVIESVKAAADVKMPIEGVVVEVNETLTDAPETVNRDPLGDGWFFKVRAVKPEQLDELLDEAGYQELTSR